MALAAVCSSIPHANNFQFFGFIVDHGVRPESAEEAQHVATELERLNIRPRILKLDWTGYRNPATLQKFETIARRLRYQTLGRACFAQGIQNLLVGHHRNDQSETILSRIIQGYNGTGLAGMVEKSALPECEGIYGVDRSGQPREPLEDPKMKGSHMLFEDGGVHILRPFLGRSKIELMNLCYKNGVKWFEDKTNADTSLTLRNTIRPLLNDHPDDNALPRALQREKLLALGRKVSRKAMLSKERAIRFLCDCSIDLRWREGYVDITFPATSRKEIYGNINATDRAEVLRQLLYLMGSNAEIPLQKLDKAVHLAFGLMDRGTHLSFGALDEDRRRRDFEEVHSFTLANTKWVMKGQYGLVQDDDEAESKRVFGDEEKARIYPAHEVPTRRLCLYPQRPPKKVLRDLNLGLADNLDSTRAIYWTKWHLWRNQYWIRVGRTQKHVQEHRIEILVRYMFQESWQRLRKSLRGNHEIALASRLHGIHKDGKDMLPVVVLKVGDKEEILSIPTLDWEHPGSARDGDFLTRKQKLQWTTEIRYKGIDFPRSPNHRIIGHRGRVARPRGLHAEKRLKADDARVAPEIEKGRRRHAMEEYYYDDGKKSDDSADEGIDEGVTFYRRRLVD